MSMFQHLREVLAARGLGGKATPKKDLPRLYWKYAANMYPTGSNGQNVTIYRDERLKVQMQVHELRKGLLKDWREVGRYYFIDSRPEIYSKETALLTMLAKLKELS